MSEFDFQTAQEVMDEQETKLKRKSTSFCAKFNYFYPTTSQETNSPFSLEQISRNISRKWDASTNLEGPKSSFEESEIEDSHENAKSILTGRIRKKIDMLKMKVESIEEDDLDEIVFSGEHDDEWDSPT